jgi:hypothetical protein
MAQSKESAYAHVSANSARSSAGRAVTRLRTVADARYLSHFGFTPRCAELRGFARKRFQTVEKTVKSLAVSRARGIVRRRKAGSRAQGCRSCALAEEQIAAFVRVLSLSGNPRRTACRLRAGTRDAATSLQHLSRAGAAGARGTLLEDRASGGC